MNACITGITPSENFINYFFKMEDGGPARTFTGKRYRNYAVWRTLKIGDSIGGLKWKDKKKRLIDADSLAYLNLLKQ